MEQVSIEQTKSGLAKVTLDRSEKMNAVTQQMSGELLQTLQKLKKDSRVKCLVITGAGHRAFCSGGDLTEFHGELNEQEAYAKLSLMKEVLYELFTFPMPTVALLNGQARGGGCEIATACDFRYGRCDAQFGFVQASLGIIPGWGGGELLYRRIRAEAASQWLMDASMYGVEEALRIGWLHKIIETEDLQDEGIFSSFLNKSNEQLRWLKKQYLSKLSIEELLEDMELEVENCARLWESSEHKEALKRFKESRKK
ncbi:enoyl-CoA hydratase/isomerase family protein [Halobacillus campisalis]|uniref:Enoyl-CoA hydratase/isomerase family protein n=1 Tax=Halobacillus campisalis TaxID=435909 RepID=A0ABW2K1W1_9BACI|nr:enoyl-CoA hydratase/isomerase family protein [Halobacillus campisalis]